MKKFSVSISKDSRIWHSIRGSERHALNRAAQHMALSDNPAIHAAGMSVQGLLLYGASAEIVKEMLTKRGYEVSVKEIECLPSSV